MHAVVAPQANHLMKITPRPHAVMMRGRGAWLWDDSGRRYLDFVQGWAVNCLGHCHPALADAVARQAATLLNPSPAYYNDQAVTLARRLAEVSGLDQVFLANSGAEANEGAIKLARKWGRLHRQGAWKIITFHNGFHGRTLATMSATGKPGWDAMFAPQVPGFPKARLNDVASVESLIDDQATAIMLELIQGEAGVLAATPSFVQALRSLCDRHGLLLIVDEVQTGVGRTGHLFACETYGVSPDLMTLGKGLGGGAPLSAVLASSAASCFDYGEQGGTFCGNALMAALGNAVLDIVSDSSFLSGVRARGAYLATGLRDLAQCHNLGEVRAHGLLQALELKPGLDANRVAERAFDLGLLINAPRSTCLRFMPALNVSEAEIAQMLELLDAALRTAV